MGKPAALHASGVTGLEGGKRLAHFLTKLVFSYERTLGVVVSVDVAHLVSHVSVGLDKNMSEERSVSLPGRSATPWIFWYCSCTSDLYFVGRDLTPAEPFTKLGQRLSHIRLAGQWRFPGRRPEPSKGPYSVR
jgi:hypothetical protein